MTPEEHYAEAVRLVAVAEASDWNSDTGREEARLAYTGAQTHASLGLLKAQGPETRDQEITYSASIEPKRIYVYGPQLAVDRFIEDSRREGSVADMRRIHRADHLRGITEDETTEIVLLGPPASEEFEARLDTLARRGVRIVRRRY